MGALIRFLPLLMLVTAAPVRAETVADWRPYTLEASERFGVPAAWIERVMRVESGGRTMLDGRPITSRAGAMGLMQLMPATWAAMRTSIGLGTDPYDPHDNILAGTAYLRLLYARFGYPGLFAAYNAGPGRYAAFLAGRARLPAETQVYLFATAGAGISARAKASEPARNDLFVVAPRSAAPPTQPAPLVPSDLFAIDRVR